MPDLLPPLLFALTAWWLGTAAVLYLNHLPRSTYRWSLGFGTLIMLACLLGLALGDTDATPGGAVLAFSQALLIWAWLEMSYFMGYVTGPRKSPCPAGCSPWTRFKLALATSLHHELIVAAFGLALIILSWEAPNPVGAWTFLTLWLMRWSAKLNIFLGVANVNEDWLPRHLHYLTSYIRHRPLNLLFPISVSVSTIIATDLFLRALAAEAFLRTGYLLVATLLALAILEHWFLVLPIRDSALWNWALRAAGRGEAHQDRRPSPQGCDRGSTPGPRRPPARSAARI
ncbi:MAG: putative photosynthetic complex assembly protein PuhE [Chromatiales bacterium]|jgi:putative photosynthetic complex assembly protein 2